MNVSLTRLTGPLLLLALLAGPSVRAEPLPAANDDPIYLLGTRAMNERRWTDAIASFDQVIQAHGSRADAALYWKAYALNKLGKPQLMEATCAQLRTDYRSSTWNRDCGVLVMQAQLSALAQDQVQGRMPKLDPIPLVIDPKVFDPKVFGTTDVGTNWYPAKRDPDSDLKILAINSMLNRDPAQAVPILHGVLTSSTQTRAVKEHAMFVLAQSHSPQAQAAMQEMLTGKDGADLQRQAIHASGVFQGKQHNDTLEAVYRNSSDAATKHAVISAFFISQDADRMVDLAKMEKNMELKRSIVSELALMQGKAATDYMMELLK